MNTRDNRLLLALGEIDEKYIKEAESKMKVTSLIKAAVVLLVVGVLSLYLFLPYGAVTSDLTAYRDSSYFPLIENIEDYRLSFKQPKYNNNFEAIGSTLGSLFTGPLAGGAAPDMDMNGAAGAPDNGGNGSYVESTDNQVEGVIESDLMKITSKYIFRLGWRSDVNYRTSLLRVYSIDKENSSLVAEYEIPKFDNEYFKDYSDGEMYLSSDTNTITIIKNYTDEKTNLSRVGIISLDVSDVNNIHTKGKISIDGSINTSRMVDGKLLLVSEYYFNRNKVDYSDPATFVPTIDSGNGAKPIRFDDIIFPDEVGNTRYSVVTLLDSDNLELLGANALLNFTNEVYVSKNNVYITREYQINREGQNKNELIITDMTDIAVLDYSGERLEKHGVITVEGRAEDQYSFDEKDGYLRVVTTTSESVTENSGDSVDFGTKQNVSLWIYDLTDNSLAYSLCDFAIEGEEATAVRFDGDKLYVCTAVVVTFTDPVYFIDLSDYENIESADTGVIEGYSDHLINFGEGFTLGIGEENWQYSKVEVYEQQAENVVSVDVFRFEGVYSTEYKSYLVNREKGIFGFGVEYFYSYDEQTDKIDSGDRYILLQFNGYELNAYIIDMEGYNMFKDTVRAAYIDGYLYITTDGELVVEQIN